MEFREIYCENCKKVLGRYNVKYYSDDMVAELIQTIHVVHTKDAIVNPKCGKKNTNFVCL